MSSELLTRVADKLRADAQFGYGNPDMQLIRDLAAHVRELEAERAKLMNENARLHERIKASEGIAAHATLRAENERLRALLRRARPFIEEGSDWCYDAPQQWLEDRIDAALKEKP